ncbi:MAG: low molecular weight protein arginine phosphatase [Chloroflexi bacterium]|nr:low molecular weight protein arginine phosphatase [Chloroflexota bacterium]
MSRVILFVCTGNICRSPMAEAFFNQIARARQEDAAWVAHSAGTWGLENQPASGHAHTVMAQRGIDLRQHRGHAVTRTDVATADAVIVMTQNHRDALAAQFAADAYKIHLLSELAQQSFDIADPYGGALAEYATCAQQIENLIASGYDQIKAWASQPPR